MDNAEETRRHLARGILRNRVAALSKENRLLRAELESERKWAALDHNALIPIMNAFIELGIRPDGGFAEYPQVIRKLVAENKRLRGYLDDACECARCCECSGWVDNCKIMAAKLRKVTDR